MNLNTLFQALLNGIMIGGIYSLIGMSLTIIFGVMKVINFCQGELLMLGMYCSYVLYEMIGLGPFESIPIVVIAMFIFGVLLQATLITRSIRIDDDDTNVLFLTAGFGILFSSSMQLIFGTNYKTVPSHFGNTTISIGGALISANKLISFGILIIITVLLFLFLKKTTIGKQIRATSQNRLGADVCGINSKIVYACTYGLGAAIAGIAGACLMSYYYVFPTVGVTYGTRSFIVVTIGTLGNIVGGFFGGLVLGCLETVGAVVVGSAYKETLVYLCFVVILIIKHRIQAKRRA